MNFIAFSDESYSTAERYRSIATFSFPEENHKHVRGELTGIFKDSNVSEFKWHRLKDAKYRFCAMKLIQAGFRVRSCNITFQKDRGQIIQISFGVRSTQADRE